MSPRQRDCKRNVHDVALVGGSARIPIVQKMIHEFFNGKEQRFTELVALFSTHTETVLPMSWEGGTMGLERRGRTNLRSVSLWRASLACECYSGRGVMKLCESGGASAAHMGVLVSKTEESIEARIQDSLKTAQDPDGAVASVF